MNALRMRRYLFVTLPLTLAVIAAATWSPRDDEPMMIELPTPSESAIYYADDDVYLLSNFGTGGPATLDDDGFITRVDAETGEIVELEWIKGTLSAPKGMAIVDQTLYVADLDAIKTYDLANDGAPLGDVPFDGLTITFPNDVCAGDDGTVFMTDTGLNADFTSSGTDAVYRIDDGRLVQVAAGADVLKSPNGCWVDVEGLLVVTFGSNEVLRISDDGEINQVSTLPNGGLDGIVSNAGVYYVTSWEAGSVFRFDFEGGRTTVAVSDSPSPADLGYDTKRHRLIVPLLQFEEGPPFNVAIYEIGDD